MDTARSDRIVQAYQEKEGKLKSLSFGFSGTWETTLDDFFPLLCPAREADWIPGWEADILHSDSKGYVSEKCIFRTVKTNPTGEGLWVFTGFKKNEYVEFVRFQPNMILHAHIDARDNGDGTVTGTWEITASALTEPGNQEAENMKKMVKREQTMLPKLIEYYLKKGKCLSKPSLAIGRLHDALKH
jgi:hypothetical protein